MGPSWTSQCVPGTHLGRCRHTDFRNKVVLKETDDVLWLQFLCRSDFRQRWDRRPLPCLQSIQHKQWLIQHKRMHTKCRNVMWRERGRQTDHWLKGSSAYRNNLPDSGKECNLLGRLSEHWQARVQWDVFRLRGSIHPNTSATHTVGHRVRFLCL